VLGSGCWVIGIKYFNLYQLEIMSYKNLEIWQEARKLVIDIHKMSLKAIEKR